MDMLLFTKFLFQSIFHGLGRRQKLRRVQHIVCLWQSRGYIAKLPAPKAGWQSGYAADCNSVNAGSIPTSASILLFICASAAQRSPRFNDAHAARKYCDMLQSVIIDAR